MKFQRTSVGLDVHARSVVGCGFDRETGEVIQRRLTPSREEVGDWIRSLPAPAAVVYEAGPTGFGLARYLIDAGIDCVVAAPSKLQRPSGDRVKTDARDARHLARLLHLGEIVAVATVVWGCMPGWIIGTKGYGVAHTSRIGRLSSIRADASRAVARTRRHRDPAATAKFGTSDS